MLILGHFLFGSLLSETETLPEQKVNLWVLAVNLLQLLLEKQFCYFMEISSPRRVSSLYSWSNYSYHVAFIRTKKNT
jgi:hypothetical protein